MIKAVNWIITNRCNGTCVHCDIGNTPAVDPDLTEADFVRVLDDSVLAEAYKMYGQDFDISFAGGEPFCRPDLQGLLDRVEEKFPGSFKCITTNGLLESRILTFVHKNQHLGFKLNVSVEGLKEAHDRLRGKGTFVQTLRTVRKIRRLYPAVPVELKLTLSPLNYDQIVNVYALALRLGCQYSFKPVENLVHYTNSRQAVSTVFSRDQLCVVRNQCFQLATEMYRRKDYRKARFIKDIPFYLAGKKRPSSCSALTESLTLMPDGRAFFCIKEPSVGTVPQDSVARLCQEQKEDFMCQSCMLSCGALKDYTNQSYDLLVANVETINRCNLDCALCTQKEIRGQERVEMSLAVFAALIDQNPQCTHVSFVGGESFLNTSLFAFMDLLDGKGISYEITTNGTLIDEDIVSRLKDCVGLERILFSLDGCEAYHDKERGQGTFAKCCQAISLMKGAFKVGVCSVLKGDNYGDIARLALFLGALGVKDHRIIYGMSLSPEVRAQTQMQFPAVQLQGPFIAGEKPTVKAVEKLFALLAGISKKNEMTFTYVPEIWRKQTRAFMEGALAQSGVACCKQLNQLRFNAQGEQIICEFIRNTHSLAMQAQLKERLLPVCERCCKLM